MPQLDTTDWDPHRPRSKKLHQEYANVDGGQVIDGDAIDVTDRSIDDDTIDLASEPEFPFSVGSFREDPLELALPYGPLRSLDAGHMSSKGALMQQLNRQIPINEYDMPEYIYRADLLDQQFICEVLTTHSSMLNAGTTTTTIPSPTQDRPDKEKLSAQIGFAQKHLDEAIVYLNYAEGFPVLPNGQPFWKQLDSEPLADYQLFVLYLSAGPTRTIHEMDCAPLPHLQELSSLHYWEWRVRSFDLYKLVKANKERLSRLLKTEDSHYKIAERLIGQVDVVLQNFNADELKEVGFEKLVAALDKLTKIQRVSVGLPANGPPEAGERNQAPTTNIIMQQIAANSPQKRDENNANLDLLADNPEAIDAAQQLIISTQKRRNNHE